jgi:hypothetical protein
MSEDTYLHYTTSPFLNELLLNFTEPSKHKLFIYSAHDTTLMHILAAVHKCEEWPGYASFVAFEVYEDGTNSFIGINNKFPVCEIKGEVVVSGEGGVLVSLQDFTKRIEGLINHEEGATKSHL